MTCSCLKVFTLSRTLYTAISHRGFYAPSPPWLTTALVMSHPQSNPPPPGGTWEVRGHAIGSCIRTHRTNKHRDNRFQFPRACQIKPKPADIISLMFHNRSRVLNKPASVSYSCSGRDAEDMCLWETTSFTAFKVFLVHFRRPSLFEVRGDIRVSWSEGERISNRHFLHPCMCRGNESTSPVQH